MAHLCILSPRTRCFGAWNLNAATPTNVASASYQALQQALAMGLGNGDFGEIETHGTGCGRLQRVNGPEERTLILLRSLGGLAKALYVRLVLQFSLIKVCDTGWRPPREPTQYEVRDLCLTRYWLVADHRSLNCSSCVDVDFKLRPIRGETSASNAAQNHGPAIDNCPKMQGSTGPTYSNFVSNSII